MVSLEKCNKLLTDGFSLLTTGGGKVPNFPWTKGIPYSFFKNENLEEDSFNASVKKVINKDRYTLEEFEFIYNYKGGLHHWHNAPRQTNIPATSGIGIITGYDNLETVDVDLKVFSTAMEKKDFWDTLMAYCEDSILDFHEKFVITKTQNEGYHILYKSKRVEGNRKLAKLKNHTEAVIETRGKNGYVFVYDRFEKGKYYSDVKYISDEDREILFDICDSFDYKVEPEIEVPKKEKTTYSNSLDDVTPWDDFNQKNDVWSIVSNDFKLVRNLNDRLVIKREGANSAHSGYIFKDKDLMFLHSTGSLYPHEKQISAYAAYTYKNHNGNFSNSAKELYEEGYGTRLKIEIPKVESKDILEQRERINRNIDFPLEVFPKEFQKYMLDCVETLDSSIDYMGCSLLWSLSVIVGNSSVIKVKNDWIERPVLWFALVGKAGIGKTHSINRVIKPLKIENGRAIRKYFKDLQKFEHYINLDKKEKDKVDEVYEPKKSQFIVGDTTIEALVQLHQESENSVGVFRDELAGWIMDMNKYRDGSDQQTWLGTWSGESIIANRVKASSNAYVSQPFMPILGGIQPSILNNFFTEDNKSSGFTDRILLSYPDESVQMYNQKELDPDLIEWYNNTMIEFYRLVKKSIVKNEDGDIDPEIFTWSDSGNIEWIRVFDKYSLMEESDKTPEYLKSIIPKIKSYITRFSLLLHILRIAMGEEDKGILISSETVLLSEKLGDYFIFMAEKIKMNAKDVFSMKNVVKDTKLSNKEKIERILNNNPDFNKTELAALLDVSRGTIYNYIKQIKK